MRFTGDKFEIEQVVSLNYIQFLGAVISFILSLRLSVRMK